MNSTLIKIFAFSFLLLSANASAAEKIEEALGRLDLKPNPLKNFPPEELVALEKISFASPEQAQAVAFEFMAKEERDSVIFIASNAFFYQQNGAEPLYIGDVIMSTYLDAFDCICAQAFSKIEENVRFTLDYTTNYMCTLNFIDFKCMGLDIPFLNRETLEQARKKTKKTKK